VDAGAGSVDDINWLLSRGYEVLAKEYSGRGVVRLSKTVAQWVQDPDWPQRSFGWVNEPATCYVRPVKRIVVRCQRKDGSFAYGVLICSLSEEHVFTLLGRPLAQAADPVAVLTAYVNFYDQRGRGVETSFKSDKQGLGFTKRSKKRFEAQHIVVLLGSLAHNVVAWAHRWLTIPQIQHYGGLRMVRDVFHISGLLRFDARANLAEILFNQDALLARWLIRPLQELLAPFHILANLGQT
jgi:hypothetical protein